MDKLVVGEKEELIFEPLYAITGGDDPGKYLLYQLRASICRAKRIDIIVSFLMESGVRLILRDLRSALDRGATVRLLTGNYLGITQPSALYLMKRELGDRVDLRFYNERHRSFHPKAYIFHYEKESEIFIGSSNISKSALTSGIEWNYRFSSRHDEWNFWRFYHTFEDLFLNHSVVIDKEELKRYSKGWRRPAVARDLERYETESEAGRGEPARQAEELFQPRGAQIEALYALEDSRAEGASRGLVYAATGIGKTYLAAFDSAGYKRVLFVAHREEILKQAAVAFRNVRKSECYGFFNKDHKDTGRPVIFASVDTLGKDEYLAERYFARDYFDYLVVDEFHHAVNEKYRKIIDYFQPKFLLGLTATPERMDGRDIYGICDYNVPYEISLKDAVNKGMLVPFHYYGIYDKTDYSGLRVVRGEYAERELNQLYVTNTDRYELIYKHYRKYRSRRALGFCCSRKHAEEMARDFSSRGVAALAVYSNSDGEFSEERDIALERLTKGEIRVIFSVDMFNEGLDIPAVDMVLFLRPTQSPVVFLQQLGRGLRRSRGKEFLTVLDFIGNYERAGRAPFLLSGLTGAECSGAGRGGEDFQFEYPDGCIVDFDMRLIDLFREMENRNLTIRDIIRREYFRVKEFLRGKTPTRMELFSCMEGGVYELCVKNARENPFRHYLEYLHGLGELTEEELVLYNGIGREFLEMLETTNMQKAYKMPVLYAFYNDGKIRMEATEEELLESWKRFFDEGTNWKDLGGGVSSYEEYKAITDRAHLGNIKRNPVRFLLASGKGFFTEREESVLGLREELREVVREGAFGEHMRDVIEYRVVEYYRRRYDGEI